ncbi:hypothetical protein B0H34DRAFT_796084 [Crassisporium funariophilum]|nr:hypothetical protein B0H34DRAFT_796084 [Crassisporium funariophilum]
MSAPYHFTPRIPAPPHSTPLSAATLNHPNRLSQRPPIHNPYDKFSQPEFDAWIGGITTALKRALGQAEDEDEHTRIEKPEEITAENGVLRYRPVAAADESEDEGVDDSFAEIKARRVLGKGKARDPREGPGFGAGDSAKPIEIASSSDEEQEEEEVELAVEEDDYDTEEEEEEEVSENDDYSWERGQSSSQKIGPPKKDKERIPVIAEDEYDSEEDYQGEDDDEEDVKYIPRSPFEEEVIDIISDEDDELVTGDPNHQDGHSEEEEWEEDSQGSGEYDEEGEDNEGQGISQLIYPSPRIRRPRAKDDIRYVEDEQDEESPEMVQDDDDIEDSQPSDEDTSFPPHIASSPAREHIEIPDPWSGPRDYAEDYYAGGEVRLAPGSRPDASHLGPYDDEIQATGADSLVTEGLSGNILYATDQRIDPSLYEDDIDGFLTPGVITPNGIEKDEQGSSDAEQDDVLYGEDEDERVIQPPSLYSRRDNRIPVDPEFISVDSDEDEQALGPEGDQERDELNEDDERGAVGIEFDELQHGDEEMLEGGPIQNFEDDILPPAGGLSLPDEVDNATAIWSLEATANVAADDYDLLYGDIDNGESQTPDQAEVISSLVDWNYPPAFPAGIPASAPGHLATPSTESLPIMEDDPITEVDSDTVVAAGEPFADEVMVEQADFFGMENKEVSASDKDDFMAFAQRETTEVVEPEASPEVNIREEIASTGAVSESTQVEASVSFTWGLAPTALNTHAPDIMDEETRKILVQTGDVTAEVDSKGTTEAVEEKETIHEAEPAVEAGVVSDEARQESQDVALGPQETEEHTDMDAQVDGDAQVTNVSNVDNHLVDIPSALGDEVVVDQSQPVATTSTATAPSLSLAFNQVQSIATTSTQTHYPYTHDVEQLPTPPSEKAQFIELPQVNDEEINNSPITRKHRVEMEEVPDEDDILLQPALETSTELAFETNVEASQGQEYSVIEAMDDEGDGFTDEDADGEVDTDVEILSVSIASDDMLSWRKDEDDELLDYTVEEPLTEGRLTEELADRATSLGVVSVGPDHAADLPQGRTAEMDEDVPHRSPSAEVGRERLVVTEPTPPQTDTEILSLSLTGNKGSLHATDRKGTAESPVRQSVPMPVTANADVPDPTSRPQTPSRHPNFILNLPGTPNFILSPTGTPRLPGEPVPVSIPIPQSVLRALRQGQTPATVQGDGLFTPAEVSAEVSATQTPIEPPSEDIHSHLLTELAQAFFGTPFASSSGEEHHDAIDNGLHALNHLETTVDPFSAPAQPAPQQTSALTSASQEPKVVASNSAGSAVFSDVQAASVPADRETSVANTPSNSTSITHRQYPNSMRVTLSRKPTDPILYSDPYPISLSTPGVGLDPSNEASEEDTEQDNSMSSISTAEKDAELEEKGDARVFDDMDDLELELQYPQESEVITEAKDDVSAPMPAENIVNVAVEAVCPAKTSQEVVDTAADVVFDVDTGKNPAVDLHQLPTQLQTTEDPFELKGIDSTDAPAAFTDAEGTIPSSVKPEDITTDQPAATQVPPVLTEVEAGQNFGKDVFLSKDLVVKGTTSIARDTPSNSTTPTTPTAAKPSKRKRDSSPATKEPGPSLPGKAKGRRASKGGKGKAKDAQSVVEEPPVSEATIYVKPRPKPKAVESVAKRAVSRKASITSTTSSSSGASAAYRMLRPSSRSPSIVSSGPSEQSTVNQPSPTVDKPHVLVHSISQPISLFHAHGQKRNNSYQLPRPLNQPPKPQISRVQSLPHVIEQHDFSIPVPFPNIAPSQASTTNAVTPTVEASPPKAAPSPAHRPPAESSNSPVTRSHCRYHRISLPKEEGGPRVCFLVPGCSLNDRELMEEEEIQDHGDATYQDSLRMIKDFEFLDFDVYLIGTLRQLVGLDILREQEVFYLPAPGEEIPRKASLRKPIAEKVAMARIPGGAESSSYAGSPAYSAQSPGSVKPSSRAESTSTAPSGLRRVLEAGRASSILSDTEPVPSDGDDLPHAKRARMSLPADQSEPKIMGPPSSQASGIWPLRNKRSKRLDADFELDHELEEDSDEIDRSARRKKKSKRGVKRTRTSEVVGRDDADNHKPKKLKTRMSAPSLQSSSMDKST